MSKSSELRKRAATLEAAGLIAPEHMKAVIKTSADSVSLAAHELEQAEIARDAAHAVVEKVRPELDALTEENASLVERAEQAEARAEKAEEIARVLADSVQTTKRRITKSEAREQLQRAVDVVMAKQADTLRLVERFFLAHKLVKNERGMSVVHHKARERDHWILGNPDDPSKPLAVFESKTEALRALHALADQLEKSAPQHLDHLDGVAHDVLVDDRRPLRRRPQPGEDADDIVPGHAGRLDGRKLSRKRVAKRGRLL